MKRLLLFCALVFGVSAVNASLYQPCANDIRPCPLPTWYLDFQMGAYFLNAPKFAFGEILSNTSGEGVQNINEFSIKRDHLIGCYPRLAVGFEFDNGWCPCSVGDNFFIELAVFYSCFDKDQENNVTIPAVTTGVGGFAFPRLNGGGDFLAALQETRISSASFSREYEYGGFQAQLGSNIFYNAKRFTFTPFMELDVDSVNQSYLLRAPLINVNGGISSSNYRLREDLTTVYWDFGLGFNFEFHCSPHCRYLFLFGQGTGFLSCAETHFSGRERVTHIPAIAPSEIHEKLCAFSGKARGKLGIGYAFGDNASLAIMGQVDYWGYIPYVQNPHRVENGVGFVGIYDGPARIEKTSTTNYALVLELVVTLF